MSEYLIDTNVVVYAYDTAAPRKQERALGMVRRLAVNGRGRLSTQVLGEFFRATTRKLTPPLSPAQAYDQVALLAEAWTVLPVTPLVVLEAARGVRDHGLGYWDAQLWATARLNQIETILTEDFTDGRILDGVRFIDPFRPTFDMASLS